MRPVDAAAAQVEPHLGGDGDHLLVLDEALVNVKCQLFVYLQLFVYPSERSELRFSLSRLKIGVVCTTTPPRALVLAAPKGVQSVRLV